LKLTGLHFQSGSLWRAGEGQTHPYRGEVKLHRHRRRHGTIDLCLTAAQAPAAAAAAAAAAVADAIAVKPCLREGVEEARHDAEAPCCLSLHSAQLHRPTGDLAWKDALKQQRKRTL
jgi:hypothetical protein